MFNQIAISYVLHIENKVYSKKTLYTMLFSNKMQFSASTSAIPASKAVLPQKQIFR